MSRRRNIPWIHRWSRPIIAGIASCGALTTAYLTIVKLTLNKAACPTQSCDLVLSSDYATIFGQPLALFGFLAYTGMLISALLPLALDRGEKKTSQLSNLENLTWILLLAGSIGMSVFSGYLMYLLFFKIQAVCIYCIASALFSLSMLVLTIIGRTWEDFGQIFFTAIVVGMVTLIGTLGVFANIGQGGVAAGQVRLEPSGQPTPGVGWEITSTSSESEIELAKHLTKIGAKEYVAWWCPHCHEQKQLFGKEAYKEINKIDCDPQGKDANPDLCKAAKIPGFPTWEIKGKQYPNVQSLQKLADISGYQGPRNFKNFPDALKYK
jgi:uncharacterized membrane protein